MKSAKNTDIGKTAALICAGVFIATFVVYYLMQEGPATPYDNFVRLADAFLHGRLYLLSNVSHIELVPLDGRYYVVPPPLPAIIIMPVVAIFGLSTNQTLISIVLGSVNVVLAYLVARELTGKRSIQFWATAMFGFGTIHWWVASSGGVWMFSHTVSLTFLFMAVLLTLRNAPPLASGLALGASYWTRLPTILSFPFFLIMYLDRWYRPAPGKSLFGRINLSPLIWLGLGTGIFVLLNAGYNYLRFGSPFDLSYYLIPGILDEIWYQKGIFDITYMPRNLKVIFAGLPRFIDEFPYVTPSWHGMAIWITTPAFVYAFFAGRSRLMAACWASIALIAFVNFCHGTWGFMQFGYRFALDFYPFLFILTVKGIGDEIKWHHITLILLGIAVNLWGILWINKFGWVGY